MKVDQEGSLLVNFGGEDLQLLPTKAAFWISTKTLFVADLHLGKGSAFRAGSIPVPSGSSQKTLEKLSTVIADVGAEKLVILGDLWHDRRGRTLQTEALLLDWRRTHATLDVALVEGNHDVKSGHLTTEHEIALLQPGTSLGPFLLHHDPRTCTSGFGLAGHLHPGACLSGEGRFKTTVPCFHLTDNCLILPAFGEFTGMSRVCATKSDRVFAILGETVREV